MAWFICHSAKGSTWEKHKYLKVLKGKYYYPDSYEGGRHLSELKKDEKEEKKKSMDLDEVYKVYGGTKKSEEKEETKKQTEKRGDLTKTQKTSRQSLPEKEKETKKSSSGKKGGSSKGKTSKTTESVRKPHEVKAAIDPKDLKAIINRINESTGRKSISKVSAKGSGKKNSSKKTSSDESAQELAESLVEKLSDVKLEYDDLKEEYKLTDKSEKVELKERMNLAKKAVDQVRNEITKAGKKNKKVRSLISELSKNE